jgi:hypothetical protein
MDDRNFSRDIETAAVATCAVSADATMVYSRAGYMFILEHHFSSKSQAVSRETLSNMSL